MYLTTNSVMEKFLKTKKGLEYLLETFPSNMLVLDAIKSIIQIKEWNS